MAITFPITLPSVPATRNVKFDMLTTVGMSSSPYTLQQQAQEWPGEMWLVSASLPPIKDRNLAAPWQAALAMLRGRAGKFYFGDPAGKTPRGALGGTPVVDGAGQSGKTLAIRGFTPSLIGVLKAFDYLQIGSGETQRLYVNLQDVNADGTGRVTIDIFPRLREAPADGAAIVFTNARGTFRLAENLRGWDYDHQLTYGIDFKAFEAF